MTTVSSFGPQADHPFEPHPNSRYPRSCGVCRRIPEVHPPSMYRPRDEAAEVRLSAIAAEAVGVPERAARTLEAFAQHRALPTGVRVRLDAVQETSEELADSWNYLVWGVEHALERMEAGDMGDAADEYARLLRTLGFIHKAWAALHGAG